MSVRTVPSDAVIVGELVDELIHCHRPSPFRFGITYDAKAGPACVTVHKVVKNGTMGEVQFRSESAARRWCKSALQAGYDVERLFGRVDVVAYASVSQRRSKYEQQVKYAAMTPEQRKILDDEIPF